MWPACADGSAMGGKVPAYPPPMATPSAPLRGAWKER
jgi:hypothetical protein